MTHYTTYYRQAREARILSAIRERLQDNAQDNRTDAERTTDAELEAQAMLLEFIATEV